MITDQKLLRVYLRSLFLSSIPNNDDKKHGNLLLRMSEMASVSSAMAEAVVSGSDGGAETSCASSTRNADTSESSTRKADNEIECTSSSHQVHEHDGDDEGMEEEEHFESIVLVFRQYGW